MSRTTLLRAGKRLARLLPAPVRKPLSAAAAERRGRADVELIVSLRVFDREYYQAQVGRRFATDEQACSHYLTAGRRAGHAPHPLFEPMVAEPKRWRRRSPEPLRENLRGKVTRDARAHWALPREWIRRGDGDWPRWVEWLADAGDTTEMPRPHDAGEIDARDGVGTLSGADNPTILTWGRYRAGAIRAAVVAQRLQANARAARITGVRPAVDPSLDQVAVTVAPDGTPTVSIILPTWNRAGMLRRAVESVQVQSFTHWELVIVDDGSDDDTLLVLQGLTRLDERIVVIPAPHGGVCRARNLGIEAAKGRYIAFLDSDNAWTPEFLQRTLAVLDSADPVTVGWAHAGIQLERESGTFYRALKGDRDLLLGGNFIDLNVLIVRRELLDRIGGFDETLERAVDFDLVLRLAAVVEPCLVPAIGTVYADAADVPRISTTEPVSWNEVVTLRHALDHRKLSPQVVGRVSVAVPLRTMITDLPDLIDRLLEEPIDLEVVMVTSGADPAVVRSVEALAATRPAVRTLHWPTASLEAAALIDLGSTVATGEYLVPWHAAYLPTEGWADALIVALQEPGVALAQPLVLDSNDLIDSGGAVFVGNDLFPSPFLGGMPREDATWLGTRAVPAALSRVVMARTDTFRAVGGFDAIFCNTYAETDLSLRLAAAGHGSTVVATDSVVLRRSSRRFGFLSDAALSVQVLRRRHKIPPGSSELWRAANFEMIGRRSEALIEIDPDADGDVVPLGAVPVVRPIPTASTEIVGHPPQLRWAIDTAAPAGARGRGWGDVYFAQSLAVALRALGQIVHVDRRTVRDGAFRDLDDVTLVLRGLDKVIPRPGGLSLMWVISHPDLVTSAECATHDAVFAASNPWAARRSEDWQQLIMPLLQCADSRLFRPGLAAPDSGDDIVFVGNSRGVFRPSVQYTLEAGLQPGVWGKGWEGLVPDGVLRDEYFPNRDLPELYAASGVVLNDHWEDMRVDGFVSNRVFEVLACGGRLITDDVAGLPTELRSGVAVYRSHVDMADILAGTWRERFPDLEGRTALAQLIHREHSFDSRAQVLLNRVLQLRADRQQ